MEGPLPPPPPPPPSSLLLLPSVLLLLLSCCEAKGEGEGGEGTAFLSRDLGGKGGAPPPCCSLPNSDAPTAGRGGGARSTASALRLGGTRGIIIDLPVPGGPNLMLLKLGCPVGAGAAFRRGLCKSELSIFGISPGGPIPGLPIPPTIADPPPRITGGSV